MTSEEKNTLVLYKTGLLSLPTSVHCSIKHKSICIYKNKVYIVSKHNTGKILVGDIETDYEITDIINKPIATYDSLIFVNNIGYYIGLLKKNSYNIYYFNPNGSTIKSLQFASSRTLHNVFKEILSEDKKLLCNCSILDKCMKLVGFFIKGYKIYFIVQILCSSECKFRRLYIFSAPIDYNKMEILDCVHLCGSYNIYSIAKCNGISKHTAKKLVFGGVTYTNGEIFIFTTADECGYIWKIKINLSLNYINNTMTLLLDDSKKPFKIHNNPVGLAHYNCSHLLIIHNDLKDKNNTYSVLLYK
jgi:hypothetical protein